MTSHLAQFSARALAASNPPTADQYEAMYDQYDANYTEKQSQYASNDEPPDALTQYVPLPDVRPARPTHTSPGPAAAHDAPCIIRP